MVSSRRILATPAIALLVASGVALNACAQGAETKPPVRQVQRAEIAESPNVVAQDLDAERAAHGQYMVELLGCGACHTDGSLAGAPRPDYVLAGSIVGIALESPLDVERPAVIYPPNLTPDLKTGLGSWNVQQIASAIRSGVGRHGQLLDLSMPYRSYAKLSVDDALAIATYLKSMPAVEHAIPKAVASGRVSQFPYVFFGIFDTEAE